MKIVKLHVCHTLIINAIFVNQTCFSGLYSTLYMLIYCALALLMGFWDVNRWIMNDGRLPLSSDFNFCESSLCAGYSNVLNLMLNRPGP